MIAKNKLAKLEKDARESLSHASNVQRYILVKPEDILAMVTEIRELRTLTDPQALTAAYMAGKEDQKLINSEHE